MGLAQVTGQLQQSPSIQCNYLTPIPRRKPEDWKLAKHNLKNDEIDLTQLWPKPVSPYLLLLFFIIPHPPKGTKSKDGNKLYRDTGLGQSYGSRPPIFHPPDAVLHHCSPKGAKSKGNNGRVKTWRPCPRRLSFQPSTLDFPP